MHQCTNHADKRVGARRKRGSVAATGRGAAPFLTIPTLGKEVLAKAGPLIDANVWLNIATLCASMVEDDFQVKEDATTPNLVNAVLASWASKHCADIQVLDDFNFIVALDDDGFGLESNVDSNDKPGHWFIAIEAGQTLNYVTVDKKLLELESAFSGLGRTAIHAAQQASFKTFVVFTPSVAKDIASYLYWQGEETDADVIENIRDQGVEEQDLDDFFLPSQFIEPFPPLFFEAGSLPDAELQNIAEAAPGGLAGEVAKVILSINGLINDGAELPGLHDYSNDLAFFSCILGIDADNDPVSRVIDDHFEQANAAGDVYTGFYGVTKVPFEVEAFNQWRENMEKGFALYSKLDQLIRLIKKGG